MPDIINTLALLAKKLGPIATGRHRFSIRDYSKYYIKKNLFRVMNLTP